MLDRVKIISKLFLASSDKNGLKLSEENVYPKCFIMVLYTLMRHGTINSNEVNIVKAV